MLLFDRIFSRRVVDRELMVICNGSIFRVAVKHTKAFEDSVGEFTLSTGNCLICPALVPFDREVVVESTHVFDFKSRLDERLTRSIWAQLLQVIAMSSPWVRMMIMLEPKLPM